MIPKLEICLVTQCVSVHRDRRYQLFGRLAQNTERTRAKAFAIIWWYYAFQIITTCQKAQFGVFCSMSERFRHGCTQAFSKFLTRTADALARDKAKGMEI
jgi:hypothetical protein